MFDWADYIMAAFIALMLVLELVSMHMRRKLTASYDALLAAQTKLLEIKSLQIAKYEEHIATQNEYISALESQLPTLQRRDR